MADKPDLNALMQTPELQKAVAEAAQKAAAAAVAEALKGADKFGNIDPSARDMFSQMALAIADMAHQGSGRVRPVAPEVMQKRAEAIARLNAILGDVHRNLKKAREEGDKEAETQWSPEYRVLAKIYYNERIIDPYRQSDVRGSPPVPQDIIWTGPPSDALRPLNPVAELIYDTYRESIGSMPRLKAVSGPNGGQVAPDNRPYWMTPGGLVVKGDPPPRAFVAQPKAFENDLGVYDNNDPEAPFVHVLGTVAQPARKNIAEHHRNR
jgi:hypothetical protein